MQMGAEVRRSPELLALRTALGKVRGRCQAALVHERVAGARAGHVLRRFGLPERAER